MTTQRGKALIHGFNAVAELKRLVLRIGEDRRVYHPRHQHRGRIEATQVSPLLSG